MSYSDEAGRHTLLLEKAATTLGRSSTQDLVLGDSCVSRQHAQILQEGGEYTVLDQTSTHGTYVNGSRVSRAVLRSGDYLQLGSVSGPRLAFELRKGGSTAKSLLSSLEGFGLATMELSSAARPMEQLNWLLAAARRLNEGGAIEDTLDALLQLTLQRTGLERGFVFVKEAAGMRMARGLQGGVAIMEEDATVSRRAIQRAIESGLRFSVSDTMADERASEWTSIVVNGIRSIYCIPLRKHGVTGDLLGLLYLDSKIAPGHMTEVDHQLLETIATEAAGLLHNALLAEAEFKARKEREELAVAARIHSGLMTVGLPTVPYAALQARSVPCLAIGGDFFDAVALDGCLCVTVADVSGKGVSAAIVAATLQGIIHAQLMAGQDLPSIAALVNKFLCSRDVGKYATLVMVKLYSDGRVEYINCGHVQPLAILGTEVRRLKEGNLVVGLIAGASYASAQEVLRVGERLLLVTDGVTEAEDEAGDAFGDDVLSGAIAGDDLDDLLQRVAEFQGAQPAQDDCTLVQVRYLGSEGRKS